METYRSAEVRWFRSGEIPAPVAAWFDALGEPVETEARADRYLAPASDALGVKLRQGSIEAKRRDQTLHRLDAGRCRATVEAWTKWSFPLADADDLPHGLPEAGWVEVGKQRRQRHADACALELSRLTIWDEVWWSVCLEATGPDAPAALMEAARQWLGAEGAPVLPEADAQGYPAWLRAYEARS